MAGRCGRQASAISSPAVFLLSEDEDLATAEQYLHSKPPSVMSQLDDVERAMFHVLPEVCDGKVTDQAGVQQWYSRSFAAATGMQLDAAQVVARLKETGMVSMCGDRMMPLPLARVSTSYLFHPVVLQRWVYKVENVSIADRMNDSVSLAWLLGRKDAVRFQPDFEILEEFTSMCDAYGYDMVAGEVLSGLVYYCLLTQRRPPAMKYQMLEYRRDAPRVVSALKKMDGLHNWGCHKAWNTLQLQLVHGVDNETAALMLNTGIRSKSVALQLNDMGFSTREDIAAGIDTIKDAGDPQLVRRVLELVGDGTNT
jgi:hypothetical protein